MAEFPSDALPPEAIYATKDALIDAINAWSHDRGYNFTIGRSTREKSGRILITYTCTRGGFPKLSQRIQQTSSRRCGCPFSINAKQLPDEGGWALRHRPDPACAFHNHAPSRLPTAYPTNEYLQPEEQASRNGLWEAEVPLKNIRAWVRQNTASKAAAKGRRATRCPPPLNPLIQQIYSKGFWTRVEIDAQDTLQSALFYHPDSIRYLKDYPQQLTLDCTGRKNKFNKPLFEVIGTDTWDRPFCVAFALLRGDTTEDFTWAVDQVKSISEYHDIPPPCVVRTDGCPACVSAVDVCFPNAVSVLSTAVSTTQRLFQEPQTCVEPADQQTNGLVSSTQPTPSSLEVFGILDLPRAPPTCSACHQQGHKMTSMVCPQRRSESDRNGAI